MFKALLKRTIPGIAVAVAALAVLWAGPAPAKELRILAWQGYADDDWVKEFEQKTGADVKVVFIGTDDEIWAKIKGSEGQDFDLFAVNTAQLQRYIDAGLVTPYDLDKVPNQKETLPRFRDLSKVSGVMRDGKEIARSRIAQLKRLKDDVREVAQGYECGITLEDFAEFEEGDGLDAYVLEQQNL